MDTKKLRQKILDLAIHGKLVPQDLNDEPASVLLERIKAEKEQLIKEGKIKRQKKSASSDTSHYGNDVPFEIPKGWVWCRLKDITSFLSRGKSPQYSEERKYPVFAQKCNLKEGGISLGQARFLDPQTINKWDSEYKLRTGDVLINSTGTGTVGRTRIFDSNCLGTYPFVVPDSHVSVVRTFKEVNSYYIYMLISSRVIQEYLEDNLAGSTNQKELYIGVLEDLFVPLPPMDEQDRIVMKSNKLFSIIDCIEKEEENLSVAVQKAKSKILDLALSGKLTSDTSHYPQLPQSQSTRWETKTIDEIFYHNTGKALNKSDSEGELYDYITTSNLYWNKFDLSSVRKMKFKPSEIAKCSVRKGDLLICEGGDVGRAAVWNYDFNIMIQNHIHRLRCRLAANPKFYYYVMMYYKSKGMISGKGIGLMGLSSKELGKLPVPYPQIEEQNDIVFYLNCIMRVFDSIES